MEGPRVAVITWASRWSDDDRRDGRPTARDHIVPSLGLASDTAVRRRHAGRPAAILRIARRRRCPRPRVSRGCDLLEQAGPARRTDCPGIRSVCYDRATAPDRAIPTTATRWKRWRQVGTVAASLVLVAVCGFWTTEIRHVRADHRTSTGEQRTITLADGSTVQLNAETGLSVTWTQNVRRLVLHQREAFFTIAPDQASPFEMEAGGGTVRALGTMSTSGHKAIASP